MAQNTYDLIVIGGGAAGLTASRTSIHLGLKVALIEKGRVGGDCTWAGCVPSKALIAAAKLAHSAREGARLGVQVGDVRINFAQVMRHVHETIHEIYAEETPQVLREEGIHVYESAAHFVDPHTVELASGERLTGRKFIIATGSSPIVPEAFADAPYLTNHNLFQLAELPQHLIILGGGPIGTEMSQAFQRLGARVTVIDMAERLLPRDDEEASRFVMEVLQGEGVELRLGVAALRAHGTPGDVHVELADGTVVSGSHLLVALGRRANVQGLQPGNAGIETDERGLLKLSRTLQTTQKHIYAAGDVTAGPQFTHYAGSQGYAAVRNQFLPFPIRGIAEHVPWATFTDPEVAHMGLTEAQARQQYGDKVMVTRLPMHRSDRAMTEGKPEGFLKAVHLANGKLLGVTIVGLQAADLLTEWIPIVSKGGNVRGVSGRTRVYPAHGSVNGVIGNSFSKAWLKRSVAGVALRLAVRVLN